MLLTGCWSPMLRVPAEARSVEVGEGGRIELLAVIPLHPDEIAVKVERGSDALIEVLDRGRVAELLDMPQSWCDDWDRRAEAVVAGQVRFATKPAQGLRMRAALWMPVCPPGG